MPRLGVMTESNHFPRAKSNALRRTRSHFHLRIEAVSSSQMLAPRPSRRASHVSIVIAVLFASIAAFAPRSVRAQAVASNGATGAHGMVVAESDYAAKAGLEILKSGGNAVDAACATALAVGVTNPASCGIGGGGFMLVYMAKSKRFYALDYRETAPLKATPSMYMRDGKPDEKLAQEGALSVAVPGEIAGIDAALRRLGTMKFQTVAAPAVRLAENGFIVSPHLGGELDHLAAAIKADPELSGVFLDAGGAPHKTGDTIYEKDWAASVRALGDDPVTKFYRGDIASAIVNYVDSRGGILSLADLAAYRPQWRDPIHREFESFDIFTFPPPSSGGVLLEMLGMLENGRIAALGANSPPYLARLIEVMRQGFLERDQYADPAFINVPIFDLMKPQHIEELRGRALHHDSHAPAANPAHDHGTSNLIVADSEGNVVALTTTINTPFGAKAAVPKLGIILNDEMDDFSVAPGVSNAYRLEGKAANEISPGKRPLSSMTPMIAMRHGKPYFASGGSGGPTILSGVLQVSLNALASKMPVIDAVNAARIHEQAAPDVVVVEEAMPQATRAQLEKMGYKLKVVPKLGAVGAMTVEPGNLRGAYDPRKGGGAEGY
jgi:gamma-glutamyltranspeptidase/glutathione hydrolase